MIIGFLFQLGTGWEQKRLKSIRETKVLHKIFVSDDVYCYVFLFQTQIKSALLCYNFLSIKFKGIILCQIMSRYIYYLSCHI